jgi:NADPH:quinone reductase-like Zn-dependent oxidoreductase
MKAIVYTTYGPPDVLQMLEVQKPIPKDNHVLIKVHATTVNRTDCGFRKPEYPLIIRVLNGIFTPKKNILGSEFAGKVEAVGTCVKSFRQGDDVFGLTGDNFGAHAEYLCLPEDASIAAKPSNMDYEQAAAVCDGLMLAYSYLREVKLQTGTKVLINGASGSIGSAAVQLAKYFGAAVTAVCKTDSLQLVKSLGADRLIDYQKDDFTADTERYDVIFDAVGKSSFFRCRHLLRNGGVYFSTEFGFLMQNPLLTVWTKAFGRKKVLFPIPKCTKDDMRFFKELIESGKYKAVIDRRYPLERIIEAHRHVESGEKIGNVVITMP